MGLNDSQSLRDTEQDTTFPNQACFLSSMFLKLVLMVVVTPFAVFFFSVCFATANIERMARIGNVERVGILGRIDALVNGDGKLCWQITE